MNREIANKLIAALESGEFTHCKCCLRDGDRYCALGVLCELHREDTGEGKWVQDESGEYVYQSGDDLFFLGGAPPSEVRWWAGLNSETGFLPYGEDFVSIATENDAVDDYSRAIAFIKQHVAEI